jgi:hypothetical protein
VFVSMKVKHCAAGVAPPLETFQHTHIAVYLCGFSAVGCICYDSIQVDSRISATAKTNARTKGLWVSFDDPADGLKLSAGSDAKICTQPQVVLSLWSVKCLFVLHHAPHHSIMCCQVFVICRSYHIVCLPVHTASHTQTAWFSFRVSSPIEDFYVLLAVRVIRVPFACSLL